MKLDAYKIVMPNLYQALNKFFESPHTVISTVVYDDEMWARPFKNNKKYFQIIVTSSNRDSLADLLFLMIQKKETLQSLPPAQFQSLIIKFNLETQHSIENAKGLFH